MPRLNLFAKGNNEVRGSLLHYTVAGKVQWNGINEIVRQRWPEWVVRVRHETCTRFDAVLAATGVVPAELAGRQLPLGAFTAASQFSQQVFTSASDVVVLSMQNEIMTGLLRQRQEGYLFYPAGWPDWTAADRQWLAGNFDNLGEIDVRASCENLARMIAQVRLKLPDAHILTYNMSAVVPGEQVHCHEGMDDCLSTRIRRFNLALIELSRQLGISVVDVDAVIASVGARRLKLDVNHFTAEGYRLIAEEVVRILEDRGCFDVAASSPGS